MLFTIRLTEHLHRLPREVVESSSLVITKIMVLDSLLSMDLLEQGLMTSRGIFRLQPFCDSVKFQKAASTLLFCKQGKIPSLVCLFCGSGLVCSNEKYKVIK